MNLAEGMTPADGLGYERWLTRQPKETQLDILGPSRHKLWQEGGITMDRFTTRTGDELTLDQLKRRDADAFARAGL